MSKDKAKKAAASRAWYARHRDRLYQDPIWVEKKKIAKRLWARAHPESRKTWSLKKLYKLSLAEYIYKLEQQRGLCACCGDMMDSPQVDHNHKTQEVRDLLCGSCNKGLGMFKDDPMRIEQALHYLNRWI